MSDIVNKAQRSKMMSNIRAVSKLEDRISKELWHAGFRLRRNNKSLFGKPDFSIKKNKIVVFIDSCFWHGCALHATIPKNNRDFWLKKLQRNVERDLEVSEYYSYRQWNMLRVWEHDLKQDFIGTVEQIANFISNIKENCRRESVRHE